MSLIFQTGKQYAFSCQIKRQRYRHRERSRNAAFLY
nr:MAG TPA: hypothetical protein [Caudoviricetes sp.]